MSRREESAGEDLGAWASHGAASNRANSAVAKMTGILPDLAIAYAFFPRPRSRSVNQGRRPSTWLLQVLSAEFVQDVHDDCNDLDSSSRRLDSATLAVVSGREASRSKPEIDAELMTTANRL
jgi:hypothetical protein